MKKTQTYLQYKQKNKNTYTSTIKNLKYRYVTIEIHSILN